MKVPEKGPRPVTEAPPHENVKRDAAPLFLRTRRGSRTSAIVGASIGFSASLFCLLVMAATVTDPEIYAIGIVFGVFGVVALVLAVRTAWGLAAGVPIRLIGFEPDRVTWGYVGEEKTLDADALESIDWSVDIDGGLTLSVRTTEGQRIIFHHINALVPKGQRPALLAFLRRHYPGVPLSESDDS